MLTLLYFLFATFSIHLTFDIVPVSNLKNFDIKIGAKYSETILKFSHVKLTSSLSYSINVRMVTTTFYRFSLFLYKDLTTLYADINKNDFSNYMKNELIYGEDTSSEFTLNNNDERDLYFFL